MTDSQETPTADEGEPRQHRAIKSFVMRAGRMTEGQQRGLDQGKPLFVLPLTDEPADFDQVFGRSAPRTLEIGFAIRCSKWPPPRRNWISSAWKCTVPASAHCSMAY
jgi:tRNA (guanine-N7-)-methyltransferase